MPITQYQIPQPTTHIILTSYMGWGNICTKTTAIRQTQTVFGTSDTKILESITVKDTFPVFEAAKTEGIPVIDLRSVTSGLNAMP